MRTVEEVKGRTEGVVVEDRGGRRDLVATPWLKGEAGHAWGLSHANQRNVLTFPRVQAALDHGNFSDAPLFTSADGSCRGHFVVICGTASGTRVRGRPSGTRGGMDMEWDALQPSPRALQFHHCFSSQCRKHSYQWVPRMKAPRGPVETSACVKSPAPIGSGMGDRGFPGSCYNGNPFWGGCTTLVRRPRSTMPLRTAPSPPHQAPGPGSTGHKQHHGPNASSSDHALPLEQGKEVKGKEKQQQQQKRREEPASLEGDKPADPCLVHKFLCPTRMVSTQRL